MTGSLRTSRPTRTRWRPHCARGAWPCPTPSPTELFTHVYADPHPLLREEQDAYADYLAGFDEDS